MARNATSRPRKKGDDSYNARRRYVRNAERNLKKAESATGAAKARYERLAQESYKNALKTYSTSNQKPSRAIERLGKQLGKVTSRLRETIVKRQEPRDVKEAIKRSYKVKETNLTDEQTRREVEATTILNSPIGRRIIGGTESIWRDEATMTGDDGSYFVDKKRILPILFKYFKVDNVADLLERIETEVGEYFYADDEGALSMYDVVKLTIQKAIMQGNFETV